MNIAVIFAGGVGKRMKTNGTPKQFLEIDEVPIIIHTLRIFEESNYIDSIVIACIESYIDYLKKLIERYKITKVRLVVKGGETGQQSIINGIKAARDICENEDDIVLIHDGVRPIIDDELILKNIENVKKYGTSISCLKQMILRVIIKKGNGARLMHLELVNMRKRRKDILSSGRKILIQITGKMLDTHFLKAMMTILYI